MEIDLNRMSLGSLRSDCPCGGLTNLKRRLEDIRRNHSFLKAIEQLTRIYDTLPGWDIEAKTEGH